MKDTEIIFLVEEDIEGGYTARALGFPVFTEGETIEEIKENVKDALRCHFEKVEDIPPLIRLHIVREELVNF